MNDDILRCICRLNSHPWNLRKPDELVFRRITGGLTNILYLVTAFDGPTEYQLLVRVFGKSDGLLNRDIENEVYKNLSRNHVSPSLIGIYDWGRLEEFLADSKPLSSGRDMVRITSDLDCVELIAKALVHLHSVQIDIDRCQVSANILSILSKWLVLAGKYGETIKVSSRFANFDPPTINSLSKQVDFVVREIREELLSHPRVIGSRFCNRLLAEVLCHNDMLAGNIMLRDRDKSVRLIDFEYAGFNFAAADIANVFTAVCESIMLSGEPQDVSRNFPSEEIQKHFLESYFGEPITDSSELEVLYAVIAGFAMADELRWSIWGIVQANQSTVEFDYVFYYNSRFQAFKEYVGIFEARFDKLQ